MMNPWFYPPELIGPPEPDALRLIGRMTELFNQCVSLPETHVEVLSTDWSDE